MKALIFTITTLAILFNSTIDKNKNTLSDTYTLSQIEKTHIENTSIKVNACYYEGEIIPSVQLPTFNVVGEKTKGTKVATTLYKGERIPLVVLPELKIVS
jgi:hypothetical protein